ncbi:uncharacterized protein [Miscanthus floridulus]|uniref:uncharacterized protein n=1 Tax=Miscanthus floridulus TaxID=154761 RepID=UPI00345B40C1
MVGATQPPLQRVEGALESDEGRPAPVDTEGVPSLPPPPLQRTRDVVQKWLRPHLSQKRQAEVPTLAPHKALKVSASSTAQWVMEVQAAIQHGAASARVDPKELDAQGEAIEAASQRAGDEALTSLEVEARESNRAKAPSVTEATEGEAKAPKTSKAEATEAGASKTIEAEVAKAKAPGTTEAEATEAGVGMAEPAAAGQLGVEQGAHLLTKGTLAEALKVAEASQAEALVRKGKAEGLEKEVSRAVEASVEVQAVLEAKIGEHNML